MIEIDGKQDYQGEFDCPNCQTPNLRLCGQQFRSKKRRFYCSHCGQRYQESCQIYIQAVAAPTNSGVTWYTNYRIKGFVCPECQTENIYFTRIDNYGKKRFVCKSCQCGQDDSIKLTNANHSLFSNEPSLVKPFNFDEDQWDLRAINPNFDQQDLPNSIINFYTIQPVWFKQAVKRYIYHLCLTDSSFGTIRACLFALRSFSRYLNQTNVVNFQQINRRLVLDYLAQEQKITKNKLGHLRSFFIISTTRGWFTIDLDIIRDVDYPKQHRGNPDPLSDRVCEQIEQNLHQLPDPIARMWLICYFAAMRPSELALLKQDCLVQEGEHWKLVWHRKKNNNYHEVPISRTIAKVVQEQIEYIENLWGDDWGYLFCH